ncbi:MAG: hypothetical protein M1815_005447 [Lichina confinis]|nr:MAG: hypothetical protein M1815_005447 [Lichina confinis]
MENESKSFYGDNLLEEDRRPTEILKALLTGLATHIINEVEPRHDDCLTPEKLANFYRVVGGDYDALFLGSPHTSLSFIYQCLGCAHSLEPTEDDFASPSSPALKRRGYVRWQTIQLALGPAEHVRYLQQAVDRFDIVDPRTGNVFPRPLPKEVFPSEPDEEMERWHDMAINRLRTEAENEQQYGDGQSDEYSHDDEEEEEEIIVEGDTDDEPDGYFPPVETLHEETKEGRRNRDESSRDLGHGHAYEYESKNQPDPRRTKDGDAKQEFPTSTSPDVDVSLGRQAQSVPETSSSQEVPLPTYEEIPTRTQSSRSKGNQAPGKHDLPATIPEVFSSSGSESENEDDSKQEEETGSKHHRIFGPAPLPANLGVVDRGDIRTLSIPTLVPRHRHQTKAPSGIKTPKLLSLSTTSAGVSDTAMHTSRLQPRQVHTTPPPPRALQAMWSLGDPRCAQGARPVYRPTSTRRQPTLVSLGSLRRLGAGRECSKHTGEYAWQREVPVI